MEEWIRNRWGGFTCLLIARNEEFMLSWRDGSLFLQYESRESNEPDSEVLISESATKECVQNAERLFGIEIPI